MANLIFPDWAVHLSIDTQTYNSEFQPFFDYHHQAGVIDMSVLDTKALCNMMLYRLYPVFLVNGDGNEKYQRVVCRDVDALLIYRDKQAINYWVSNNKVAHGITDYQYHDIPLLGGMCGFKSKELKQRLRVNTFEEMMAMKSLDFTVKGNDQVFLNSIILPKVTDSITEHFIAGMKMSKNGDCHTVIQDIDLGLPASYRESNTLLKHLGQAGFDIEPALAFCRKHLTNEDYYLQAERLFPHVFTYNQY